MGKVGLAVVLGLDFWSMVVTATLIVALWDTAESLLVLLGLCSKVIAAAAYNCKDAEGCEWKVRKLQTSE